MSVNPHLDPRRIRAQQRLRYSNLQEQEAESESKTAAALAQDREA